MQYLSARMARAILALKSCIRPCQNGLGHSGTQVMQLHGRARMARTILTLKSFNWSCQNGSSHSGTQVMQLAVPEWRLEPFWHSNHASGRARKARTILALTFGQWHCGITCVQEWLEPFWHCQQYLSAIIARAILALQLCN